jgi:chromosome segregation ATPase
MTKVKNSDDKIEELEKNLKVKEAELNYVAKLYDEKNSDFLIKLGTSEGRISELEKILEKANQTVIAKENEVNQLKNEKNELNQLKKEFNEINSQLTLKSEELDKSKLEIHKSYQNIDELKKQLAANELMINDLKQTISEKEKVIEQQNTDLEQYKSELKDLKGPELEDSDTSSGLRLKCAKCGAVGKDIKTVEDKNKPLSYIGNLPMYAKINICKKCGFEF